LDCTDLRWLLNDDGTYRILDEQQSSEDSDFLLSDIDEERDSDVFKEEEDDDDDGGNQNYGDDCCTSGPARSNDGPEIDSFPNSYSFHDTWIMYSPSIYSSPFINNYSTFFGNHDHFFDHDSNEDEEDLATGFLDPNDFFPLAMELESLDNNASFLGDYFHDPCNDVS
jgi:hypothetical protein